MEIGFVERFEARKFG